MKIFYFVRRLEAIPSCIYNMQMIKELGYEIIPIVGRTTQQLKTLLDKFDKPYVMEVSDIELTKTKKIIFLLRYMLFIRKIRKNIKNDDLIFLGTADTAIHLYFTIRKNIFVLFLLELHEKPWYNNLLLKKIAHRANAVVCCEKNRSRYLMGKWKLNKLPYSISNKPYWIPFEKREQNIDSEVKYFIEQIGRRKAVIYQARNIHFAQELIQLARALSEMDKDFVLVLIGEVVSGEIRDKIESIYANTIFTGIINAPLHLEITSYGYIGVAVYQETTLNNMFCAPNKIYEYGAFGIPSLCNDLPGLVETVGIKRAGVCVDWNSLEDIKRAINEIDSQYDFYSKNALKLFETEDNGRVMNKIVEEIMR